MNRINGHLMKYGYNLEYSLDDNLCSEALINHLGKKGYKKFWNSFDQNWYRTGGNFSTGDHLSMSLRCHDTSLTHFVRDIEPNMI